jgi:pimeloyl-ACP methyl ester carboxylesterase
MPDQAVAVARLGPRRRRAICRAGNEGSDATSRLIDTRGRRCGCPVPSREHLRVGRDGPGRRWRSPPRVRTPRRRAAPGSSPRVAQQESGVAPPDRQPFRRVHGGGVGCAGRRPLIGPTRDVPSVDCADCVAAFVAALGLDRAHVAGVSWGGSLAVELYRQHRTVPDTLIVVSACAGWAGSLPAEVVEHWLRLYLRNLELPPDGWTPAVIQTLLTDGATESMVDELTSILSEFHPAAMAVAIRPWLKPTSATCCRASTFQRLCSTAAGPRSQRVLIRRSARHVMAEMRPSLWRDQ